MLLSDRDRDPATLGTAAWGEVSRIAWTGPSRSATTSPIGTHATSSGRRGRWPCTFPPSLACPTCPTWSELKIYRTFLTISWIA